MVRPSYAELPRYAEGEAIVMYKAAELQDTARALSSAGPAQGAAEELGVELVHSYRPVKADSVEEDAGTEAGSRAARTLAADGVETAEPEEYAAAHVKSASGETTEQLITRLRGNSNVVAVMPNYIMTFASTESTEYRPNDELYDEQWSLEKINMPELWTRTNEAASEEVVVAVIDSGILYDHEDLKDNMYAFDDINLLEKIEDTFDGAEGLYTTEDFLGSHGVWFHNRVEGAYGSEYEADLSGNVTVLEPVPSGPGDTSIAAFADMKNVTENSHNVGDMYGHGTHVAGTIGAVTDNGKGVAGIARNVKLMDVSVGTPMQAKFGGYVFYNAATFASDQMRAVDFILAAKEAGINIRVVNISLGFWAPSDTFSDSGRYSPYVSKMKALSDAGILICAAAGNDNQNLDAPADVSEGVFAGNFAGQMQMPAMLDLENLITVGASDENDGRAYFSNYSPSGRYTDIFAPGANILSSCRTALIQSDNGEEFGIADPSGYVAIEGTSMASPHVTGVAALLCSLYPEKSAAEIKRMILEGADGSVLKDGCSAYGRLDAYAAWKLGQSGGSGGGCRAAHGTAALLAFPVLWILSRSRAKCKRGGDR